MDKVLGLKPKPYVEFEEVIIKKRPCINFGKSIKKEIGYPYIRTTFNDEYECNYGSLAEQRKYASEQFKEQSSKLVIESMSDKLTYDGLLKAKEKIRKSDHFGEPTHLIMRPEVYSALNLEANLFATLPKYTWDSSEWKTMSKSTTRPTIHIKCL